PVQICTTVPLSVRLPQSSTHLFFSSFAVNGPVGVVDGASARSLPSEVIHMSGRHGQVAPPIAEFCVPSSTPPVLVVLNHSSCEFAPPANSSLGTCTREDVPLNVAAEASGKRPAAPS